MRLFSRACELLLGNAPLALHFVLTTTTMGSLVNASIATCWLPEFTYKPVEAPPSRLSALSMDRSDATSRSATSPSEKDGLGLAMNNRRPCLSMATMLRREPAALALNCVACPFRTSMGDDWVACCSCSLLGS